MKIHIVVIGFGQNRKHLIPALMSVSNEFPEVKVTIIDRRDFDPIIKNDEWLTEDQIRWCKERFLHEDNDDKEDIINNLILKGITKNMVCRRIFIFLFLTMHLSMLLKDILIMQIFLLLKNHGQ
jgi:hypothetical protein